MAAGIRRPQQSARHNRQTSPHHADPIRRHDRVDGDRGERPRTEQRHTVVGTPEDDHQRKPKCDELDAEYAEQDDSRFGLPVTPGCPSERERDRNSGAVTKDMQLNRPVEFDVIVDDRPIADGSDDASVGIGDDVVRAEPRARGWRAGIGHDARQHHAARPEVSLEPVIFGSANVAVQEKDEVRDERRSKDVNPPARSTATHRRFL